MPSEPPQIVPANWLDLGALRHLEQICFPQDAWPLLDLIAILTAPGILRLKATHNGKMIGFIATETKPRDPTAWIATIGVLPEYRRRGIGAALLTAIEAQLPTPTYQHICLSVRLSNTQAQQLYQKFGYRRVQIWAAYYEGGEDALIMEKTLYHQSERTHTACPPP